ncbi:uncharacterized protein GIQ15_04310 [Arthroderma uncinatum]|uniref:uncharacterized protein n=1 Tax=Arthroderma uncinatum TaxID=74035 RepID=UPI00144AD0E7|nr:uncharacterized protein GIQ15_04310 [Arthroderma uncinatum]KAF3481551.1 hypothetical protein GIQ15_04310 [Arthroderma uncinatum]
MEETRSPITPEPMRPPPLQPPMRPANPSGGYLPKSENQLRHGWVEQQRRLNQTTYELHRARMDNNNLRSDLSDQIQLCRAMGGENQQLRIRLQKADAELEELRRESHKFWIEISRLRQDRKTSQAGWQDHRAAVSCPAGGDVGVSLTSLASTLKELERRAEYINSALEVALKGSGKEEGHSR